MNRLTALTLTATALAGTNLSPLGAQALAKIRVGVGTVESYSEGSYAAELGYYKPAGLDAEINTLINGGAITAGVVSGAIDVGTTNTGSMSLAHLHGFPIYLIAPGGYYSSSSPTTVLVVAKDSPIQTARDLNGKTIGVTTLNDLQQVAIMKWIDDNGGDAKSIKYVEIHNGSLVPSLLAGRSDATALLEPQLTDARDKIRVLGNAYDSIGKTFMISGWIANKTWYDRNPATAQKFVAAMMRTADWANKHQREAAAVLSKLSGIPLETVSKMNRSTFGTSLDPTVIQPAIDAMTKYGALPRSFPIAELFPPKP
jgi:NitT/TauT family transport system substrate-binding protein